MRSCPRLAQALSQSDMGNLQNRHNLIQNLIQNEGALSWCLKNRLRCSISPSSVPTRTGFASHGTSRDQNTYFMDGTFNKPLVYQECNQRAPWPLNQQIIPTSPTQTPPSLAACNTPTTPPGRPAGNTTQAQPSSPRSSSSPPPRVTTASPARVKHTRPTTLPHPPSERTHASRRGSSPRPHPYRRRT